LKKQAVRHKAMSWIMCNGYLCFHFMGGAVFVGREIRFRQQGITKYHPQHTATRRMFKAPKAVDGFEQLQGGGDEV
jgi:hypothetical protein